MFLVADSSSVNRSDGFPLPHRVMNPGLPQDFYFSSGCSTGVADWDGLLLHSP